MKKLKKLGALALTMVLMLSLGTGMKTNAQEPETGSITVHKLATDEQAVYSALKDAATKANGKELTATEVEALGEVTPLSGITFTLTKVVDDDTTSPTTENYTADTSFGTDGKTELKTDENGLIQFQNLPLGTYLLEEQESTLVKTPMDPALIRVPTYIGTDGTAADGNWLYDIHVYPKNMLHTDGPELEKDVIEEGNDDAAVSMGDSFSWIITADIPVGVATAQKYIITDSLDTRLDYDSSKTPTVTMRAADAASGSAGTVLTAGTDYEFSAGTDNRSLSFTFTTDGLTKLGSCEGGKVVITFYTTLNETALGELASAIPNEAVLDYQNAQGNEYLKKSDEPEVHTGGVSLKKVNKADTSKTLEGAKFKIYTSEKDALAGENAVQRDGADYKVTTGEDGIAVFTGLAYGTATGEKASTETTTDYWIVETKAPEGFVPLTAPVKVTVSKTSHEEVNSIEVLNASTYELPFTGGIGTVLFMIGGIVLLGAAFILIVKDRRKENV